MSAVKWWVTSKETTLNNTVLLKGDQTNSQPFLHLKQPKHSSPVLKSQTSQTFPCTDRSCISFLTCPDNRSWVTWRNQRPAEASSSTTSFGKYADHLEPVIASAVWLNSTWIRKKHLQHEATGELLFWGLNLAAVAPALLSKPLLGFCIHQKLTVDVVASSENTDECVHDVRVTVVVFLCALCPTSLYLLSVSQERLIYREICHQTGSGQSNSHSSSLGFVFQMSAPEYPQ